MFKIFLLRSVCGVKTALLIALQIFMGVTYASSINEITAQYEYADTRKLVELVERAAVMVESRGELAFEQFKRPNSEWFHGETYFYVFTPDGTCVFHAETPELVGRNLIDLKDIHGKSITRELVKIGSSSEQDSRGWIFFEWGHGPQLTPKWKSAYARRVKTPEGKVYIVGSGAYDLKMERIFVSRQVNNAVRYLRQNGSETAFAAYKNPATPFSFLGSYIFVLDEEGKTMVDPAFPNNPGRSILYFRDAVGAQPLVDLFERLKTSNSSSVQYLWRRSGEALPARKVFYAQKVEVGGKIMIVGSDYYRATPIWMKD